MGCLGCILCQNQLRFSYKVDSVEAPASVGFRNCLCNVGPLASVA